MTVSSVGTASRDYSTWSAWEADSPANLVTADDTWEGEGYNDSEFVVTGQVLNIAGITTDATRNVQVRCATGESFADHADAATNALTYNASNGVALRDNGTGTTAVTVSVPHTTITGLQISKDGSTFSCIFNNASGGNVTVRDCVMINTDNAAYYVLTTTSTTACTYINLLLEQLDDAYGIYSQGAAHLYVNCTVACTRSGGSPQIGIQAVADSPQLENCCSFGFTTDYSGTFGTSTNNASDGTGSPGSNPQDSLTFADQFEDVVTPADLRLKSGSDLEAAGVQSGETNDLDIIGQARDTSTPEIGCWEFTVAAVATYEQTDFRVFKDAV